METHMETYAAARHPGECSSAATAKSQIERRGIVLTGGRPAVSYSGSTPQWK